MSEAAAAAARRANRLCTTVSVTLAILMMVAEFAITDPDHGPVYRPDYQDPATYIAYALLASLFVRGRVRDYFVKRATGRDT